MAAPLLLVAVQIHGYPWAWALLVIPALVLWLIWRHPPSPVMGMSTEPRPIPRWVAKVVVAVFVTIAAGAFGVWLWWALWGNHSPQGTPPPDRWLNVMMGLGAVAAVLAFFGGAYLAARYGRRASVSISAVPHLIPDGVVVATRPVVKAVGVLKVKFHGPRGALVRVAEVYLAPKEASGLKEGRHWEEVAVFGEQFAEAGEELATTTLFRLPPLPPSVIGWRVSVGIQAPTRWMPGSSTSWTDRIFVERPAGGQ